MSARRLISCPFSEAISALQIMPIPPRWRGRKIRARAPSCRSMRRVSSTAIQICSSKVLANGITRARSEAVLSRNPGRWQKHRESSRIAERGVRRRRAASDGAMASILERVVAVQNCSLPIRIPRAVVPDSWISKPCWASIGRAVIPAPVILHLLSLTVKPFIAKMSLIRGASWKIILGSDRAWVSSLKAATDPGPWILSCGCSALCSSSSWVRRACSRRLMTYTNN